ncbi:hypothetical protein EJ05DRAFT_476349 [Pseudovirgaria hyperparasitica]|uniref:TMEM205-like domain-containing protein n=1 Tax=Pseudovirgaria hyperparasitica TaxID=470096 RepID=A0A6A6W921_9PEZI|nr:uncharacterized protein EJ05DRAFT_476349 [Pseudovirgaria hyperparasitica]KAF2758087.1 hypothetical protein EJ05DRAFT_476349 [Pseudovirgaria hyperparasitica]
MPSLSQISSLAPYHIISYGTLLGSTIFQSFVGGIIAFRVLPRPQFSTLQKHTFPVYFGMQTFLSAALALTYPFGGIKSVFSAEHKWTLGLPIATMVISSVANTLYLGPETTRVMILRKHQETRDGKKAYDEGPHSEDMQKLNKQFGALHGISTLVNLGGLVAMLWHGFVLAEKLTA